MADPAQSRITVRHGGDTRRDCLTPGAGALGAIGTAIAIRPFWFRPCHAWGYDTSCATSARMRQGPAPVGLFVPPIEFAAATAIKIG